MEENVSLTDAIMTDILPKDIFQDFDFGNISEEDKQTLIQNAEDANIGTRACLEITVTLYGKAFSFANKLYSHNQNGIYQNYVRALGFSISTAKRILKCYEEYHNRPNKVLYDKNGNERGFFELGAHKIRAISSLPERIKEQVYEDSANIFDLNVKQVDALVRKAKETGDYSEELVEEIRKKDEKIANSEQQQKQLQQEKEQKDNEIAELKAKIQELEQIKVQPVEKVEPEIVEKIVEVEKVVEKEVIPEKLKAELETYKKLAQENKNNIPDYVLDELDTLRKTVSEQDEKLKDAKRTVEAIATQQNSKFGTQNIDWSLLGNVVNSFLSKSSEYTYMKEAFSNESGKNKSFVKSQVDRIENWVVDMKRMMNVDLTIGNAIYIENNQTEIIEEDN